MSDILVIDLIKASWQDAQRETDPDKRARLEKDARALEDIWQRSPYALASTRDQMTAAIGNASLNIAERQDQIVLELRGFTSTWSSRGDRLDAFLDTMPEQMRGLKSSVEHAHEAISNQNTLMAAQNECLGELTAATEANGARLGKLESDTEALKRGQITFTKRLEELDQRHAQQWEELTATVEQLNQRLTDDEARFEARIDRKRERIDALEAENTELREELTTIKEYMATNRRGEFDEMKDRLATVEQRLNERS